MEVKELSGAVLLNQLLTTHLGPIFSAHFVDS